MCVNILLVNIVVLIEQIDWKKTKPVTFERKQMFFL